MTTTQIIGNSLTLWVFPITVMFLMEDHCLSWWTLVWPPCQDNTFNVLRKDKATLVNKNHYTLNLTYVALNINKNSICHTGVAHWRSSVCARGIVERLSVVYLKKMWFQSTLTPMITIVKARIGWHFKLKSSDVLTLVKLLMCCRFYAAWDSVKKIRFAWTVKKKTLWTEVKQEHKRSTSALARMVTNVEMGIILGPAMPLLFFLSALSVKTAACAERVCARYYKVKLADKMAVQVPVFLGLGAAIQVGVVTAILWDLQFLF